MERKPHYFYALKLPTEQKQLLDKRSCDLQKNFSFNRWVHYEDYHITLAFLGNVPPPKLQASIKLVGASVRERGSFLLRINHLGIFGKKYAPRVLWAGVEEESKLSQLRKAVFFACLQADFTLETRPFHPHITLARKWAGVESFTDAFLHRYDSLKEKSIDFYASKVVLYETHIERIPKYEAIKTFSLKDPCH